jgi:hypothetical protein
MKAKLSKSMLTINGQRAGVCIDAGPWTSTVPASLIKIRSKAGCFPSSFRNALQVENNSDSREDYFEADCIRLMPGHPLYETAKALVS